MSTRLSEVEHEHGSRKPGEIQLPAQTAWPIVLGFGFTLLFAGLLTDVSVSALGAVLSLAGCVCWVRGEVPHAHEEGGAVGGVGQWKGLARHRVRGRHLPRERRRPRPR